VTAQLLDVAILTRDRPGEGLRRDDLGTIVEVRTPDPFIVESVAAWGRTQALVTLGPVCAVADNDAADPV
jgi:hypothetical protein